MVPASGRVLRGESGVDATWRAGNRDRDFACEIEAGEIVALRSGQVMEELHRGDSFGATLALVPAQSAGARSDLSYRAAITSSLLFIPAGELAAVIQQAPLADEQHDAAATLRLLERVPLFADLPRISPSRLPSRCHQQREARDRSDSVDDDEPFGQWQLLPVIVQIQDCAASGSG